MSKKQEAAIEPIADIAALRADIDKGLKHYKVFEAAKEAIDLVQSLDGQLKTLEQRVATTDSVLLDRQNHLDELNAEILAARESSKQDIAAANEFAAKLVTDAKEEAKDILAKAKAKLSDIEDKVALAEKDLTVINAQVDAATATKAELDALISKIKAV